MCVFAEAIMYWILLAFLWIAGSHSSGEHVAGAGRHREINRAGTAVAPRLYGASQDSTARPNGQETAEPACNHRTSRSNSFTGALSHGIPANDGRVPFLIDDPYSQVTINGYPRQILERLPRFGDLGSLRRLGLIPRMLPLEENRVYMSNVPVKDARMADLQNTKTGLENALSSKVKGLVENAKRSDYGRKESMNGHSNSDHLSNGGTAVATSNKASAMSKDPQGWGSSSRSNYGGSASGTSGFGAAKGSNYLGYSEGISDQGVSAGSTGRASSTAFDTFSDIGFSWSQLDDTVGVNSGSIDLLSEGSMGQFLGGEMGGWPYGSSSVAGFGGAAAGAAMGAAGSSSAAAPGVAVQAGRGSAGSAAGKLGAVASAGGVSAAAGRKKQGHTLGSNQ